MNPHFRTALCALAVTAAAATLPAFAGAAAPAPRVSLPVISDIKADPLRDEITHAVGRLKLFAVTNGRFGPSVPMRASELQSILVKASQKYPDVYVKPAASKAGSAALTRAQAVLMVAQSLKEWSRRDAILLETNAKVNPLRYFYEDNGFKDGKSVQKPYRAAYAVMIYLGVTPDRSTLSPAARCTRAYAAALVARANPGIPGCTGLALDCAGQFLPGAGGIRIKLEEQVHTPKCIFPAPDRVPSRTFSQAPGLASINPDLKIVQMRRVGENPLIIKAVRVEGNLQIESAPAIVVSPEDAERIRQLGRDTLLLQTWKVGVFDFTRTPQKAVPAEPAPVAPAAEPAPTTPPAPAPAPAPGQ